MRFEFAPYALIPRGSLSAQAGAAPRSGALLKIDFEGVGPGFADCHPWPELGDAATEEQLKALAADALTPLLHRSIAFARVDAQARAQGKSLLQNLAIPPSHRLWTDPFRLDAAALTTLSAQGVSRVKIKLGRDWSEESRRLEELFSVAATSGIRFRLDFNGKASEAALTSFFEKAGTSARAAIEFIEDPFPYDAALWSRIQKRWGIALALDRWPAQLSADQLTATSASFLILKPAVQNPETCVRVARALGWRLVVTSYLDHPLGQRQAAWVAAHTTSEICGLNSEDAYELTPFSAAVFSDQSGTGFGYDALLAQQPWSPFQ